MAENVYDLNVLGTTINEERLRSFVIERWEADLEKLPKVGTKTIKYFHKIGIHSQYDLIYKFLSLNNGDFDQCLTFMQSTSHINTFYKHITLLILYKMHRTFAIQDPPIDWTERFQHDD